MIIAMASLNGHKSGLLVFMLVFMTLGKWLRLFLFVTQMRGVYEKFKQRCEAVSFVR
jgi:hypothetical protein